MNTPTPLPPEPGYELIGSREEYSAPPSPFRIQKFIAFLRKYWWVPVLTLILALGAAAADIFLAPPQLCFQGGHVGN